MITWEHIYFGVVGRSVVFAIPRDVSWTQLDMQTWKPLIHRFGVRRPQAFTAVLSLEHVSALCRYIGGYSLRIPVISTDRSLPDSVTAISGNLCSFFRIMNAECRPLVVVTGLDVVSLERSIILNSELKISNHCLSMLGLLVWKLAYSLLIQ